MCPPGPFSTSSDFRERRLGEVRRIHFPRTSANKGPGSHQGDSGPICELISLFRPPFLLPSLPPAALSLLFQLGTLLRQRMSLPLILTTVVLNYPGPYPSSDRRLPSSSLAASALADLARAPASPPALNPQRPRAWGCSLWPLRALRLYHGPQCSPAA